jgi:26S proteasome regulatory subunit T6
MATVAMDVSQPAALPAAGDESPAAKGRGGGEGLRRYYQQHVHDLELAIRQKNEDLRRLEAGRNELNGRGNAPRRSSLTRNPSLSPHSLW